MIKELYNALIAKSKVGWNETDIGRQYEQISEFINNDYSQSWNIYKQYGKSLWRGEKDLIEPTVYLISPNKRQSQNTKNYYTILFSELLPSWKDWPKRNHCVVCTTSERKARNYGNSFRIFPKNNSDIAIGSNSDFWRCFPKIGMHDMFDLDDFNDSFSDLINHLINESYLADKNYETKTGIITVLNSLKKIIKNESNDSEIFSYNGSTGGLFRFLYDNRKNMIEGLDDLFNPILNGNILILIEQLNEQWQDDRECWVSNDCLFIPYSIAEEIKGV